MRLSPSPPAVPAFDPSVTAFLLDVDGTLIDIAPTPGAVHVPEGLTASLRALRRRCSDAVAVVTGRPVAQVDALFGDAPFAVAGEHGAAMRLAPGAAVVVAPLPDVPPSWVAQARALAAAHVGALFEPKAHGFALHYRGAPHCAEPFRQALQHLVAGAPGAFSVLEAKMAWELRPHGIDKGAAVRSLMAQPPFAGRVPVYVGDDVTDEDGMQAARALGGAGLRVGVHFADPAAVRAWVNTLATA